MTPADPPPAEPVPPRGAVSAAAFGPLVWFAAAVGGGLAVCPAEAVAVRRFGPEQVPARPPGMLLVAVTDGGRAFGPNAGGWHPRAVVVAARFPSPNANRPEWALWSWRPNVVERTAADFVGVRAGSDYVAVPDPDGPFAGTCTVIGAAVSVWPLLCAAACWGLWRAVRRVRSPPRFAPPPWRTAARRLARPWVWAAAGLAAFEAADRPADRGPAFAAVTADPPASWGTTVARVPADGWHPRVATGFLSVPVEKPPIWEQRPADPAARYDDWGLPRGDRHEPPEFVVEVDRPNWGVEWELRRPDLAGPPTFSFGGVPLPPRYLASATVSLWWLAAVCLLANGVTFWRRRRERAKVAG